MPYLRGAACAGQLESPDLGWEQAQDQGAEIRRTGTQGKSREMRGGIQGDHAALPTRCACDRGKQGLRWEWGREGGFDSDFGLGLQSCSDPGRVRVRVRVAESPEHLESLEDQDQSSRGVQKSPKRAIGQWRRWRH